MEIITRSQAKVEGLKTYFTGKPCPKGHVANRKTGSGTCVECCNAGTKQWHTENADHNANYGKAYRAMRGKDLLDKKRQYQKNWTVENKEEKRRRDAEYERAKRQARDVDFLAFRTATTKRYEAARINAIPAWADRNVIDGMYEIAQVFRRVGLNIHVDHAIPLQGATVSGLHTHDNLQLMIGSINQSKSNRQWPDMP